METVIAFIRIYSRRLELFRLLLCLLSFLKVYDRKDMKKRRFLWDHVKIET